MIILKDTFQDVQKIIQYGLFASKARDSTKNNIYQGGCVITGCDPKFYCLIHKKKF